MGKHAKYTPRHRAEIVHPLARLPKGVVIGGVAAAAVVGTSSAVAAIEPAHPTTTTTALAAKPIIGKHVATRAAAVSRSVTRAKLAADAAEARAKAEAAAAAKAKADAAAKAKAALAMPEVSPGSARALAQAKMAAYGWGGDQFGCLDALWSRESHWNVYAANGSGAYGIPQALPGSKMGAGWHDSADTQITWGLGYIERRYGSPCGAWGHSQSTGWY